MKPEFKVGVLAILSLVAVVAFGYVLGLINPFSNSHTLDLAYNFAGGIEIGSPVRVMGIKVGKVKSIEFMPEQKVGEEEVKLKIRVSIDRKAWRTLREDSQFYINLAGVIGEKFIEATPGSFDRKELQPGSLIRGEDPPRIDQLISQSYGLAGKIFDMVEKNEGSVVDTINTLNQLVLNFDRVLKQLDRASNKTDVIKLITNLTALTDDLSFLSKKLRGRDAEETYKLLNRLLWRLEDLDAAAIRKFLQEEGIKARLF